MVIKYEFVTGEIAEIELSKDIAEIAIEIGRETYNNERRETRRHNSLEKKNEQGFQFEDKSVAVDIIVEKKETSKALHNALEKLLPQQKVLVQKMFFQDISITQIARAEGVNEAAIRNRLKKIYKKLKNI
ncbi:sigma-70 family RNA polymerase sigma factor [Clostridium sp. CM028]|uniref:RNA polymerase sigma factor n=1 Tax=Clostridium sp. CM028 TaxID=2851575 RepID=UPI001C6F4DE0|nr:sigma factor-like helix-turn-helix DNA-binding protein [Clostridium sp. CM028]MBW9148521.1 sigma-70 family RNA polymerase sigma factor [Clostridium sp. CM028]WLC61091.1 sigma-70 family RNA polymerase sigma factor [Clostridium sp. CM028]